MRATLVNSSGERLITGCLVLLAIVYTLQVVSPLRINTDSYRLLSMAVSAYQGQGYLVAGYADQFPPAYPAVVRILLQTGLASSKTLIILNLTCLLAGLVILHAWSKTQSGSVRTMLPLVFVLASWVTVKHVTIPLTEFLYLGLSSLSLFFVMVYWRQAGRRKWWSFGMAVLLGYLALQCRSAGLALWPVLALACVLHQDSAPFAARLLTKRRYVAAILGASAALLCAAWLMVRETSWYQLQFTRPGSYWQSLLASYGREHIGAFSMQNLRYRVLEFGNMFSNVPSNRATQLVPIQYLVGLVSWCVVLYGAWLLFRARCLLPLPLYFLSYSVLMLLWPYYDPRFWLPVLPVLAILFLTAVDDLVSRWPTARYAFRCYLVGFVLLGILALLFSTRISLSGREFSELYGDGSYRMTYRFAFQNGKDVDMNQVSEGQVQILRIFEPLAAIDAPGD